LAKRFIDLDPQTNATISLVDEEKWEELKDNNLTLFHLFNDTRPHDRC
jgi:chromosome partitioning protein